MTENKIFKKIKETMKKQNQSAVSVANDLQLHPSTIRRWLRLERKIRMSRLYLLLGAINLKLIMKTKGE